MEGPGQAVLALLPGFSQAGDDVAVRIALHQGVDNVGSHGELVGGAGGQVVQAGHFAAVQRGIGGLLPRQSAGHADEQRQAQQ